jgi:hypothetical protein
MFKDELIALQQKANPRRDITHIVTEFKETIKNCVKDGFCKDNTMSFPIVSGHIDCKNPLYHEPTCYIEDLSVVEKVFKKEGRYVRGISGAARDPHDLLSGNPEFQDMCLETILFLLLS